MIGRVVNITQCICVNFHYLIPFYLGSHNVLREHCQTSLLIAFKLMVSRVYSNIYINTLFLPRNRTRTPENQLLKYFLLVLLGDSSFCMMKTVGLSLYSFFHFLYHHIGEVAGYIPDPKSTQAMQKHPSRVKEITDESQPNRMLISTSE